MSNITSIVQFSNDHSQISCLFSKKENCLPFCVPLVKHIGVYATLILSAFAQIIKESADVGKYNDWWFPFSYSDIYNRIGISEKRVNSALHRMNNLGVVQTTRLNRKSKQQFFRLVPIEIRDGKLLIYKDYHKDNKMPLNIGGEND